MKKIYFVFFLSLLFSGCYTEQEVYNLEPDTPANSFWENGKQFVWDNEDSVIVSMGFNSSYPGEVVMDVSIDNRSGSPVTFDPSLVYLFRCNTDTSSPVPHIYYATNPVKQEDSLQHAIKQEKRNIRGNVIFSALLGVAYVATQFVPVNTEMPHYNRRGAVDFANAVAQSGLAQARENDMANIDAMHGNINYWQKGALNKSTVNPGGYERGMIHFKVPDSPFYKIYMHLNDRVYSFTFKEKTKNPD